MEGRLNLDVAGSIADLQAAVKDFELKKKLYKTMFRGKGLDFDGYRTFTQEDDAIYIDWRASKRANRLLTKQYVEEKDLKILFVVDVGDNMVFGSTNKLKCECAAEFSLALTHLILSSGDKVGFILFGEELVQKVEPSKGLRQLSLFEDFLIDGKNYGGGSNLKAALDFLINYVDQSVKAVFIVSDFLNVDEKLTEDLKLVGDKFESVAVMIKDPLDKTIPSTAAEVVLEDPNTGEQLLINPRIAKSRYEFYAAKQENLFRDLLKGAGIDLLSLNTNEPFVPSLGEFLKERIRKGRVI